MTPIALTRLVVLTALAGVCVLAALRPSSAEDACAADAKKVCAGVERGSGRLVSCLRDHQADLSDACKAQLRAKADKAQKACGPDTEKFCKDVKPGKGRIASCLKEHEADLSPACKAERAALHLKQTGAPGPAAAAASKL